MGLLDTILGRRSKMEAAERLIERGGFLIRLHRYTDRLGIARDAPNSLKYSALLIFTGGTIRDVLDLTPVNRDTSLKEGAALLLVLQQGLHALMTLDFGSNAVGTHEYKDLAAKIYTFVLAKLFGFDVENLDADEKALSLLLFANTITKITKDNNHNILQGAFDAWDLFLIDDVGIKDLADIYLKTLVWVTNSTAKP